MDPRFISDEPLAPYDRHVRRELASFSADVLRRISRRSGDALEDAAAMVRGYQDAALVASSTGRTRPGSSVTPRSISWRSARRLGKRKNPCCRGRGPLLEAYACDAAAGPADEASSSCWSGSRVLAAANRRRSSPSPRVWEVIGGGEEGPAGSLTQSITIETLRTLVSSGRYEAALEASRVETRDGIPMLEAIRREAHLVSLAGSAARRRRCASRPSGPRTRTRSGARSSNIGTPSARRVR